jgi:hypothetical protein
MAVTVTPRPGMNYAGGDSPTWDVDFNIEGTSDPVEARLQLLYQTDAIYDGLVRQTPRVVHQGGDFFIGTITYAKSAPLPGRLEYQFEIGGKTEKKYQSLSTTSYPSTAPDYNGAIAVVKSGDTIDVQGIDVDVPSKAFSLKWTLDASAFTSALEQNLYAMSIAPVNSAPFMGYAAGELLYKGSSGGLKEGDETGELTLKFEASPNLTGLTIGGIGGISKQGWQLIDIVREASDATGSGTKFMTPKITGIYVHTVFYTSNFSALLGI